MEPVRSGEMLNLVNASGGKIGHYGDRKVALQTEDEFGWETVVGLPFQVCDVKRPQAQSARLLRRATLFNLVRKRKTVSL